MGLSFWVSKQLDVVFVSDVNHTVPQFLLCHLEVRKESYLHYHAFVDSH